MGEYMNLGLIIKGFVVGVGKIIPGVSGAMLAMFMGIYEELMEAVTHFFDDKKKHFYLLFNFGIGVFLAIVLFSKIILFLLNNYYNITIYLFLGLIMGTVFKFKKNIRFNFKNTILFLIALLGIFFISIYQNNDLYVYQNNIINWLYVLLLGGIDAFTSIVPGISGTAIFMLLGSYSFILSILGNPFSFLFILYIIGMVIGVILTCFLMYYLLKRRKEEVNMVILAFAIASIFLLFLNVFTATSLPLIIVFILGMFLGYLFDN